MRSQFILVSALSLLGAPAAFAQAAPAPAPQASPAAPAPAAAPTVGAKVYDSQGVELGTIEAVQADSVVLASGAAKVALPTSAIGTGAKGLTVGMTKAQLDAAAAQGQAQAAAAVKTKLVAGAEVRGVNGVNVLGTIKSSTAELVTLTTPKGEVSLPVTAFGMGPQGLIVGLTAQQFDAAVAQAQPAPAN